MFHIDNNTKMRFERKFLVSGYSTEQIRNIVNTHPSMFLIPFPDRHINNIYFDTEEFQYFKDNVEGVSNRVKMRIRWYGDLFGIIAKPVLEFKIKRGPVGYKVSHNLPTFEISKGFNVDDIIRNMMTNGLTKDLEFFLKSHKPVLLNRYHRNYYLSKDKKFRVTVDNELSYVKVFKKRTSTSWKRKDPVSSVIELKYDMNNDRVAKFVSNKFPFRMTKNSKYVTGIFSLYS